MRRHPAKHPPKHVRRAAARLMEAGADDIRVEVGKRYLLSWTSGEQQLRVTAAMTDSGNAFEGLWAAIRALFRARGLEVPA